MVLTHTANHIYAHPFPTVTLAYFLRYCSPQINPFAAHVLSTDTISSHVDSDTGRLHTTRIHLKKSRLPSSVVRLLPSSLTGGALEKASYILETSVVDIREGWMHTQSRNLDFARILSVNERQFYRKPQTSPTSPNSSTTEVETTVIFRSRLGERIRGRLGQTPEKAQGQDPVSQEGGWLSKGWMGGALGIRSIQKSIESIASTKTQDQLGKSREGMRILLERLRQSGLIGVLELSKRTQQRA